LFFLVKDVLPSDLGMTLAESFLTLFIDFCGERGNPPAHGPSEKSQIMDTESVFDPKKYHGPIDVGRIVEHIEGDSLYNLKRLEARKHWEMPFSLEKYEAFYKDRERLVDDEEEVYQNLVATAATSYFNDSGIDQQEKTLVKFSKYERAEMMTKLMHKHVPGTKPSEFMQVYAEVNAFIGKQKLAIVDYVEKVAIPSIIEHRKREHKRAKLVARKASPPE
jgi:hypothetical protein